MLAQPHMSPAPFSAASAASPPSSSSGKLVSVCGRVLPLQSTTIDADACAGVASVCLRQVFYNPHAEPLRVTYQTPLPSDGAVTGYRFRFGDEEICGRVLIKEHARELFEEAVLEGKTAAILDEQRSSVFTQEVGNIPPHCEVEIEIQLDQRLRWVQTVGWEWRFPTVVGARYMGAEGRTENAPALAVTATEQDTKVALVMGLTVRDQELEGIPHSSSHALALSRAEGHHRVTLGAAAGLDRDLVVRWSVTQTQPGLEVDVAQPHAGHAHAHEAFALLTLTPPKHVDPEQAVARDIIFLLDTSGSMGGQPLAQATAVVSAMIDTLTAQDQLQMIEYSSRARNWKRHAVHATAAHKHNARKWLRSLRAGGSTEMKEGLLAALAQPRPEAQRQIILLSDGYIGFESEIVRTVLEELPTGSRLHTVGVGSSINRSLTEPVARAGRGIEVIIDIDEAPDAAAQRLVAATQLPVLVDVEVGGSALLDVAQTRCPDLYAGAPALLNARVRAEGGELCVRARSVHGVWEHRVTLPGQAHAQTATPLPALYARQKVEDLETQRACGRQVDAALEALGVEFQISTRRTSWVAVSASPVVDPRCPTRRETMPQQVPYGTSVAGFGLRAALSTDVPTMTMDMSEEIEAVVMPRKPMASAAAVFGGPRKKESMTRGARRKRGPADKTRTRARRIAAPSISAPAPGSAPSGRVTAPSWQGTWRKLSKHGVITIQVGDALAWVCPKTLVLHCDDGSVHELEVDPSLSTSSGQLNAGSVLRIAVKLPPGLLTPGLKVTLATVLTAAGQVTITLG